MLDSSPRARVVAALCTTLLVVACGSREGGAPPGGGGPGGAPGGPGGAPPAVPVTVVTLKPETVTLTRELPGRTSASLIAEVRPQATGIVKQRLFTEGSKVSAGQALYRIDDATYRADLATAQAILARAQATLETSRLNARRAQELVKIDAVSRQDYENAMVAEKQAEADVASAKAAVDRVNVNLAYTRIVSPIGGRIGKSAVTQGALVTANQTDALARVQQLDPVYVDVTQSSAEWLELRRQVAAGRMSGGLDVPVSILLEDGTRYPAPGKLQFADVSVDPNTGSFLLRVVVPNPNEVLLPGMYVRAMVASGVRQGALLVPQRAVARDPKGSTSVMVVGADGKVAPRPVKVATTIGDRWLVEDGLAAGDRVVIEGLQKIRPGAAVAATEAGAAPAAAPAAAPQAPNAAAGKAPNAAAGKAPADPAKPAAAPAK
jgi:membrane fusion protein, multidrug efflux system